MYSVLWGRPADASSEYFMKAFPWAVLGAAILLMLTWSGRELAGTSAAARAPQNDTTDPKPPVYVSDFDIDVVSANPVSKPEEDPHKRASLLVELMSTKVVAALQKAGYGATRMHSGDARPDSGVGIRGLFAEVDSENHWRRAIIRSATDSGKMQALVAIANLSKPDQALYEIANLPGNEDKPGAVITLSPYVPLTKYDLSKDADEDVFKVIAPRVVNDLTDLLKRNPAAMPQ
jgi:hypothetical protein